ncbi:MAG: phosphotransferase [Proteobacteria bacterium]|nr:phosphotransferase [Pseudomonadota bacterium]
MRDYLQDYFQDHDLRDIFSDVVGCSEAKTLQTMLEKAIKDHLHTAIEKILFIQSSIGVVFGLLLANQQQVVLKIYSPKIALNYLEKMNQIQTLFHQEGYPAPNVLSTLFPFGKSLAGFYELVEGRKENAHQSIIRTELASALAEFSLLVDKHTLLPLENFFQQAMGKRLWPVPHNVLFNLKKSSKGAGWIAKKALTARKALNAFAAPKRLAHTDWGVKNAIFKDKRLVGIFDWDSLGAMSEVEMVGRACAQFTADWESDFKITPTPHEAREFVNAYQEQRKRTFTKEEYKIISAAADSLIALIARFEHAGGGQNQPYQDLLISCEENSLLFS